MRNRPELRITALPEVFGDGGRVRRAYEWEGDPTAPILLSQRTADDLPWPMALIEQNFLMKGGWYLRLDVRGAWHRRIWLIAARRIKRAWEWFTVRCVLTLHIWGLASYELGRAPTWRDIGIRRNRNA